MQYFRTLINLTIVLRVSNCLAKLIERKRIDLETKHSSSNKHLLDSSFSMLNLMSYFS